MISESYVSFETAKLLKEAGLDVPCTSQYTEGMGVWNVEYPYDFNKDDFGYSRPTQALAARWLREVYKLHVFAKRTYEYALDKFSWGYYIQNSDYEYCKNFEIGFDKYEQAIEEGVREAIKLIKK